MVVIDKFKVAYLHINKTGGTSITGYLTELAGEKNVKQMGPTHGPLAPNLRFLGNRFNDYNILISIRNPFARVISIYLFRKTRYQDGDISETTRKAYEMPLAEWFMEIIKDSDRLTDLSITESMLVNGELPDNVHVIALETINKDMYNFCKNILKLKKFKDVPHLNKTNFYKNHYTKWLTEELRESIYEWDQWVIDEYYPWAMY